MLLLQVKQAVEALPPLIEGNWLLRPWITEQYWSQFISPARAASGKKRKPRAGTIYGWSKNATQYRSMIGHGAIWRPDRPMTIDNHRAVGDELKRLASSQTPDRAHKNIEAIRAELENWLFAEASRDNRNLTNNQLNIYYSGEAVKGYRTAEEKLAALDQVRTILTGSYPDSKPLRDILKRLTTARSAVIKNLAR